MTTFRMATLAAAMALATGHAFAQADHGAHGNAGNQPAGTQQMLDMLGKMADSPSTKAFEEANAKMHADMAIEFSGDADFDFVRGMIPHHQGAVDMARIVNEHGKDPDLRKLADGIIGAQESEIAFMRSWLEKNGPPAQSPAAGSPSTKAFEEANAKMHHGMMIEYSGDADLDFVRGMIPHHQGAVDMARIILEHGKDPELRKLAENIIASQEDEIAFMKGWLEKNGPPVVEGETMPGMGH